VTLRINLRGVKPDKPVPRLDGSAILPANSSALAARPFAGYNSSVSSVTPAIRVKVLFFGGLKEVAGRAEEIVEVHEGARIEDLFARCVGVKPELARFRPSLVASRNQEFAAWSTPLRSGDEVAFLPPVSGG
jgi:molybdopterin converting factor small subunit